MNYDSYRCIEAERRGRILTLTLNNPPLNAVDDVIHEELARIFADVQLDDEADIVVLTGAGRAFSAGGDLNQMKEAYAEGEMRLTLVDAKRIVFSLLDLEKPIIARVNGHAMGLGATIALFCDVIYMSTAARIADPHVSIGVVAGDGGAVIWPQLIGYARAKEYLMTGKPLTGEEAARIGLVNHAVAPEDLDEAVYGFAEELAAGPQKAIRWTKVSANIGLKQLAHSIMDTSLAYEWITFKTEDHGEAIDAFLEKRKPNFTGA
ncbi:MAG: enoyl-CoA hydratase-related protein [Alphaproteobacteria bacterium]|jgi:enoyl-CoA hydratase|nr:enoyl-CoA hydratase-related protein [Alphaproteobacteria bacterium]